MENRSKRYYNEKKKIYILDVKKKIKMNTHSIKRTHTHTKWGNK